MNGVTSLPRATQSPGLIGDFPGWLDQSQIKAVTLTAQPVPLVKRYSWFQLLSMNEDSPARAQHDSGAGAAVKLDDASPAQ
jgi:hypothetical protein